METDEFGTVLFFVRSEERSSQSRSHSEEPGSIPRLRSQREIRVQFPQVNHDLTAIHYLYYMPRGYRSRHRDTHDTMLSVLYLGLGSLVWLQY